MALIALYPAQAPARASLGVIPSSVAISSQTFHNWASVKPTRFAMRFTQALCTACVIFCSMIRI